MESTAIIGVAALIFTVIGAVWTQGLWISRQFSVLKDFVNTKVDTVTDKLQYHERHDDQRFTDISNNLWAVRLENAQNKAYKGSNVRRAHEPSDESGS